MTRGENVVNFSYQSAIFHIFLKKSKRQFQIIRMDVCQILIWSLWEIREEPVRSIRRIDQLRNWIFKIETIIDLDSIEDLWSESSFMKDL